MQAVVHACAQTCPPLDDAAFLDFAKAYDTVDRDFLMRAMEIGGGIAPHQGVGQQEQQQQQQQQQLPFMWDGTAGTGRTAKTAGMVGWAHTLLHDTRASAVVNGWFSVGFSFPFFGEVPFMGRSP